MNIMTSLYISIGGLAGTIALTIGFLKFFGKKIVEQQMQKSIEQHKFKINLEFDRIQKINQREFEVLPELWNKIVHFQHTCYFFLSTPVLSKDINTLTQIDLNIFLNSLPILENDKNFIRNSQERNSAYINVVKRNGVDTLNKKYEEFNLFYRLNKIFLTLQIVEKISDIDKYYFQIASLYRTEVNKPELLKSLFDSFKDTSKRKIDDLFPLIRNRLQFNDE